MQPLAPQAPLENPVGQGGTVVVRQGRMHSEKRFVLRETLRVADLGGLLRARAYRLAREMGALRVAIKTTFMMGYSRRDLSPIVDPVVLGDLLAILAEAGLSRVSVVEAPNFYGAHFQGRAVQDVATYFGIGSVVDASRDQEGGVCRSWRDADFRIVLGKMRSHPVDGASLCIAALDGICEAPRGLSPDTAAISRVLAECPPHFAVLDAYENCPDSVVGLMACRKPKHPLRFYAGDDALTVDLVAASHMGISDPRAIPVLRQAVDRFTGKLGVNGVDEVISQWRHLGEDHLSALLGRLAASLSPAEAARQPLVVPQMDPCEFPTRGRPAAWLLIGRRVLQKVLGLEPPA
ncbi:MAG: DUF362 domain-containing protein [Armatimonadetes bacterium]|nr:DUF362 domain-containing protein [Armatimonadota bacterium]